MRISVIVALSLSGVAASLAASGPDGAPQGAGAESAAQPRAAIAQLAETLRDSGWWNHLRAPGAWEQRRALGPALVEELSARYGWNSPADRFWIDAVEEIQAVPPWDLQGRLDTFVDVLSDRYELDEKQRGVLSDLIVREGTQAMSRHGLQMLQIGLAARQAWVAGEPITAEQVAEWAGSAEPIFQDVRQQLTAAVGEFTQALDPAQREVVASDFGLVNRRLDALHEVGRAWARGQWSPRDWALAGEPRAAGADSATGDVTSAEGGADVIAMSPADGPAARAPADEDDDAWAAYVRVFIRKYALDDAQQQRAWIVYRDSQDQADRVRKRYAAHVEHVERRAQLAADGPSPTARDSLAARQTSALDELFARLKARLERLPTRAQRRAAGDDDRSSMRPTTRPANP